MEICNRDSSVVTPARLIGPTSEEDAHDIGTARVIAPKTLPMNEGISDFQMYSPTTKGIESIQLTRDW